ncbi:MAG: AAA family ATPase [Desulfovibrionaceae bacterium]|nr:AAA family ATPase [Desulfovibrionaceae bacterium]
MYIKSLHIEGFGIYHDLDLQDLPQGLIIFLGANEAGKSTCLEFLRSMLTGFPQGRKAQNLKPLRGGRLGGSLSVILEQGEELKISRYKDKNLGLTLSTPKGQMLPPSRLNELLQGVTREVYAKVFGFSLEELERKLNPEDVQDALYSATFGAGLKEPQAVLKGLNDNLAKLFTPRGSQSYIQQTLKDYKELTGLIQDLEEQYGSYDSLALKLLNSKQNLKNLEQEKQLLEQEDRKLKRRLDTWDRWNEWQALEIKLTELPTQATFPENGLQKLDQLQREERQKSYAQARQTEKCKKLHERLTKLNPNTQILVELPGLLRLAEYKSAFKEAERRLPEQEINYQRLKGELESTLLHLGSGWNCERIRQIDLSLFSHNNLESLGLELRAAQSSKEAALARLEQANLEVDEAKASVEKAIVEVEQIVIPEQILDEVERDDLRHKLAKLEEAIRQRPEKLETLKKAQNNAERAFDSLGLEKTLSSEQEDKLALILKNQHKIESLASEVQAKAQVVDQLESKLELQESKIKTLNARKEALNQSYANETPDRAILEEQAENLRKLRQLLQVQEHDREDYAALSQEIQKEPSPSINKIWPLMLVGILLIVVGSSMLGLNLFFKLTSLKLTDTLEVPLSLWSGYLVLLAGVLGLWGGSPRNNEEIKRRLEEREHKEERLKALEDKISQATKELEDLALKAKIDPLNHLTLDAAEERVVKDRESCILSEHYQASLAKLTVEMEASQRERQELLAEIEAKEQEEQGVRHSWHECLSALGLQTIPAASSAQTFLTRVEMANLSFENFKQANLAKEHLEAEIEALALEIRSLKPLAEKLTLTQEIEIPILILAAKQLLQSLHSADKLQAKKTAALDKLSLLKEEQNKLEARRFEADLNLKKTEQRLNQSKTRWEKGLQDLELDPSLNPQTAKEACASMQEALNLEQALNKAKSILDNLEQTLKNFINPLSQILERIGLKPLLKTDGGCDYLESYAKAFSLAKDAERLKQEREQVIARIKEEENELDLCQAELKEVQTEIINLLKLADSSNTQEFLEKSRLYQVRLKWLEQKTNLEAQLKVAAASEPLDCFLKGFNLAERETQELRQAEIKHRLEEITRLQNEAIKEVASLESQVEHLNSSQELALKLQEREALKTTIIAQAKNWATIALASAILQKTREDFEQERQPEVLKIASEIFQRITANKWKGIVISLDKNKTLSMLPGQGHEIVAPENLSRGTQEQAYLSLRLAYILSHANLAEPLPLLMDEVLVNFDPERAERTAKELLRLTAGGLGKPHQIFYFTCHKEIVELLTQDKKARLYKVEDGHMERVDVN